MAWLRKQLVVRADSRGEERFEAAEATGTG